MFRFGDPGGRMYTSVGTSNVNLLALWTAKLGVSTWSVSAGSGRTTGSALALETSNNFSAWDQLQKTLTNQATLGVALGLKMPSSWINQDGNYSIPFIQFLDAGSLQIDVRIWSNGSIAVTRNGTVLGTTAAGLIPMGAWCHVEAKITFSTTVGTVYVAVNGVQALSLTSQNTSASTNAFASRISVGMGSALVTNTGFVGTYLFDDIIVYDGQTTDANGFTDVTGPIGDCNLSWLLPTGPGTTTQFTPDSGSNYARVNEATPDGDTSYVSDATVGHIDTYALADLPGTAATVKSIAQIHYARKDDAGSRGIKGELRSAAANAAHATEIALGNNYQYYFNNWGQNPNNGSPANWTATTVNALESGQTVSS